MGPTHAAAFIFVTLTIIAWVVAEGNGTGSPASAWRRFTAAYRDGGGDFPWRHAIRLGTWLAALLTTAISVAALLTMRWWASGRTRPAAWTTSRPRRLRYVALVSAAILTAAALRLPLARGSMWWDELWNVRFATMGEWTASAPEKPKQFHAWGWDRALWYYGKPTNHAVQTVPSRLSILTWNRWTGARPGTINELVLRLPVFLGGLLGIWLTAGLARRWSGDAAGVATAWVMALHPWLLRYGVDARAYGMIIWILPFTLRAAWEALTPPGGGRWRWWWALAAGMCLLMWAHALSHASICSALFIAGIVVIRRQNRSPEVRRFLIARLVAMAALGSCIFFILFLPCFLQAMCWHSKNQDGNLLTLRYAAETLAEIGSGADRITNPAVWLFLIPAAVGCLLPGRLSGGGRIWLAAALAGYAAFAAIVALRGGFFYHRFVMGLAPVLAVGFGTACTHLRLPRLAAPAVVGSLALLWLPQLRLLTSRSYCPWRETASFLSEAGKASGDRAILAGFGLGANMLECYLPQVRDHRRDGVSALIEEARRDNRPLFIAWAYHDYLRSIMPEDMALLEDPGHFTTVSVLPGIEPQFDCRIARWNATP